MEENDREAFEAFAQNCPMGKYNITRRGDGYDSSHTQLMWETWRAAKQDQRNLDVPTDVIESLAHRRCNRYLHKETRTQREYTFQLYNLVNFAHEILKVSK